MSDLSIRTAEGFQDWAGLLALIRGAFAYMDERIDPPSSAHRLTMENLEEKCQAETTFLAFTGPRLVGCAFAADRGDLVYLGKLAVLPEFQARGIGKALVRAVEAHARALGKPVIELQTRVELVENQQAFARLGFRETERTAHAGYSRPTSLTMRKLLA